MSGIIIIHYENIYRKKYSDRLKLPLGNQQIHLYIVICSIMLNKVNVILHNIELKMYRKCFLSINHIFCYDENMHMYNFYKLTSLLYVLLLLFLF